MPRPPNPEDDPELFDAIDLGGRKSPGVATLSGHDRVHEWDVQQGNAQSGANTRLKGDKPQEFTVTFYLVRDEAQGIDDWVEWESFVEVIEATVAGPTPKAVEIYHPDLASQRPPIACVAKATIGGAVHDGKGGKTVAVKFQEYRPAKPKGGTTSGTITKRGKETNDPNAAAKAELAALTAQYQQTPWG